MGHKFEIKYWDGTNDIHFDYSDDWEMTVLLMKECKKITKSKCVSILWRE